MISGSLTFISIPIAITIMLIVISIIFVDFIGTIIASLWIMLFSSRTDFKDAYYDMNKGFFYFITPSEREMRIPI